MAKKPDHGGTETFGENQDLVLVGEIGAAQGLKGEVRLRSYTQDPAAIATYRPLCDEAGAAIIEIERIRKASKTLIARIKGVRTREGAEALTGTKLYVSRAAMPKAQDGEWYVADLIGLEALGPDGAPLGKVVGVHNYGASDIIEVAQGDGAQNLLVAFTDETVPEVDIEKGRLVVVPPRELEG